MKKYFTSFLLFISLNILSVVPVPPFYFPGDSLTSYTGIYEIFEEDHVCILHILGPSREGYIEFILLSNSANGCFAKKTGWARVENDKAVYVDPDTWCILEFTLLENSVMVKERGCYENQGAVSCEFSGIYTKKGL